MGRKNEAPHPYVQGLSVMGMIAVGIIVYLFFAPLLGFPMPKQSSDDYMAAEEMDYALKGEVYYDDPAMDTSYDEYYYEYEE